MKDKEQDRDLESNKLERSRKEGRSHDKGSGRRGRSREGGRHIMERK